MSPEEARDHIVPAEAVACVPLIAVIPAGHDDALDSFGGVSRDCDEGGSDFDLAEDDRHRFDEDLPAEGEDVETTDARVVFVEGSVSVVCPLFIDVLSEALACLKAELSWQAQEACSGVLRCHGRSVVSCDIQLLCCVAGDHW